MSAFIAVAGPLLPHIVLAAPACFPPIEVPRADVVRVEKNGVIVISDGRAARLEGILLPAGASDHAPQSLADQAIAALDSLATGQPVSLAAEVPKEDRYGRIRAQILVRKNGDDVWLQREILRKGLARAAIAPDRSECVEELYAAEAAARRAGAGLWSSPAYAIRKPSQAEDDDIGTFQIVDGTIDSVSNSGGRIFLDFVTNEDTAFAATISADDMKRFRQIGVDPYAYMKQDIRVHGWIERIGHSPEIELATPAQVEVVQPK